MAKTKLDASGLVMPKATAVWLVENTALTFEQIAGVTELHPIEVQALADEDVGRGIVGRNPIEHGEIEETELEKAQADQNYIMKLAKRKDLPSVKVRAKGPKYTPVSKRGDKPDAIAYIIKHNPEISDAQITKLVGTTKSTISRVRDKTHPNMSTIKPRHPVDLGLCSYTELEAASKKGFKAQGKTDAEIEAHKEQMRAASKPEEKTEDQNAGFDFSNFTGKSGDRKIEEMDPESFFKSSSSES